jgi:hypothetical protein
MKMTLATVEGRMFKKWCVELDNGRYIDNDRNLMNMTSWSPVKDNLCCYTFWTKWGAMKCAKAYAGLRNGTMVPEAPSMHKRMVFHT